MKFASVFHFHPSLILDTTRNCRLLNITKAWLLLDNIDHIVFRQVSYRASWAIKIIAKSLFLTTLVIIPCNHLYRPNQPSTTCSMWDSVHANATYTHIIQDEAVKEKLLHIFRIDSNVVSRCKQCFHVFADGGAWQLATRARNLNLQPITPSTENRNKGKWWRMFFFYSLHLHTNKHWLYYPYL